MKLILTFLLLTGMALAKNDLTHRPKSFSASGGKAVFIDFLTADYAINYDAGGRSSFVTATIRFDAPESGMPLFDSVEAPTSVMLNGTKVTSSQVKTPSGETTLRVVNQVVPTGTHTMVISVPLSTLVEYKDGGVKSAFWTSDLTDRRFLERYMPANLEYDQVKMTFNVSFKGNKKSQVIYANGAVEENNDSSFKVSFPEYFNASSVFFHTVPEGSVDELKFNLKSVDGRTIPVVIYKGRGLLNGSATLESLKEATTEIFHELEGDYGAWPHPVLVIYNAGSGGMEYSGATMTSASALGHEMFHSYFARGVMPANGNAGWLDEALASWRDKGYQSLEKLSGTSKMSAHPYYTRATDSSAYTFGERFMSYMDGKLKEKGGLKPFMRYMVDQKIFTPIFVEEFIKEMSGFYGVSVEEDFKKYTFGNVNRFSESLKSGNSHIHRKMSLEELKNYL